MPSFYLDEDLSGDLAGGLRGLGYDAVHTREIGNTGWIDPRQLAFATQQSRVLVTANLIDFRMLHQAWSVWAALPGAGLGAHAGILAVPNPNAMHATVMAQLLDEFARRHEPADLRGRLLRYRPAPGWEDFSAVR